MFNNSKPSSFAASFRELCGSDRRPLPRRRRTHGPEGGEDGGRPVRVQSQHPEAGLSGLLAGRRRNAVQLQRLGVAQLGPAAEARRAGRPRLDCRETGRLAGSCFDFQRCPPLLKSSYAVASPPFFRDTLWNSVLNEPRLKGRGQTCKGVQFFMFVLHIFYIKIVLLESTNCTFGQNIVFFLLNICTKTQKRLCNKKNMFLDVLLVPSNTNKHWLTVKIHIFNQVSSR